MPPPTHQPEVAAMIGLSVWKPTPGIARQSSGRSVTSAPAVKARSPAADRMATRCSGAASKAWNALCSSTATAALIAFIFSGRLMRMIEIGPRSSMITTLIALVLPEGVRVTLPQRLRHLHNAADIDVVPVFLGIACLGVE